MDEQTKLNIKNYIIQYRNLYPKESIINKLKENGLQEYEINELYNEIDYETPTQQTNNTYQKKDLSNVTDYKEKSSSRFAVYGIIILLSIGLGTFGFFYFNNNSDSTSSTTNQLSNQNQQNEEEIFLPVCEENLNCNDNILSTSDHCFTKRNACVNIPIMMCINNDNYCPPSCTSSEDNDCENDYYKYKDNILEYKMNYYDNWNMTRDLSNLEVSYEIDENNLMLIMILKNDINGTLEEIGNLYITSYEDELENFNLNEKGYDYENDLEYYYVRATVEINNSIFVLKTRFFESYDNYIYSVNSIYNFTDPKLIKQIEDMEESFSFYNASIEKDKLNNKYKSLEKPFLWKIEHENYTHSHIFGTIHLTKSALFNFTDYMDEAILSSSGVYTELILNQNLMNQMVTMVTLEEEESLKEMIPKKLYEDIDNLLQEIYMSLELFDNIKIWALEQLLQTLIQSSTVEENQILDSYISGIASDNLIDVGPLEKLEEQIEVFDSLSTEEQIYMLNQTYYNVMHFLKSGYSPDSTLYELYMSGNETLMEFYLHNYQKAYASEYDAELLDKIYNTLLYKRNGVMAERIINKITENNKTYFFTMGVGHLVGDSSVNEILKENNFKLTRIR